MDIVARERWFRSVVKIELSILSRGWKLDRRMETRTYIYVRDDRRQQCGYLYVIRIDYLMSAKSNVHPRGYRMPNLFPFPDSSFVQISTAAGAIDRSMLTSQDGVEHPSNRRVMIFNEYCVPR